MSDPTKETLDEYYDRVGKENERQGHKFADISRRDACADRIAGELLCAGRIAVALYSLKGIPDKILDGTMDLYMPKNIATAAYEYADALIAEGNK